jgi:hypothetical protein
MRFVSAKGHIKTRSPQIVDACSGRFRKTKTHCRPASCASLQLLRRRRADLFCWSQDLVTGVASVSVFAWNVFLSALTWDFMHPPLLGNLVEVSAFRLPGETNSKL